MSIKNVIKPLLPEAALRAVRRARLARVRAQYSRLSVADTFAEIYRKRVWCSSSEEPFTSGAGSDARFVLDYVDNVRQLIGRTGARSVVDLGCGDFRIGRALTMNQGFDYIGIDVVPALIEFNSAHFTGPTTHFRCVNAIEDELPPADLCLVRQVFQHLSNPEIAKVLARCRVYPYVLVTEHIYVGPDCIPNRDKPHGPDIRVYDRSGVFLDQPPFSLVVRTVLEVPYAREEVLRTVLWENPPSQIGATQA